MQLGGATGLSGAVFTNGTASGAFYLNGLSCVWNLVAPQDPVEAWRLVVWFTTIDIEYADLCAYTQAWLGGSHVRGTAHGTGAE